MQIGVNSSKVKCVQGPYCLSKNMYSEKGKVTDGKSIIGFWIGAWYLETAMETSESVTNKNICTIFHIAFFGFNLSTFIFQLLTKHLGMRAKFPMIRNTTTL